MFEKNLQAVRYWRLVCCQQVMGAQVQQVTNVYELISLSPVKAAVEKAVPFIAMATGNVGHSLQIELDSAYPT